MTARFASPRTTGLICAVAAVGLGLVYMAAAGAPASYLIVNLAALILGGALWLALGRTATTVFTTGAILLGLAALLLGTAWFGIAAEGASRWIRIGPLLVQVSLILVPVMLVLYARRPDLLGTVAMMIAGVALALQPDRAMAGVLVAGLVALSLARPGRMPIVAAVMTVLAFGWAMLVPDRLGAVPYVDRVLYTAFDVHPLVGAAVLTGAVALLMPALIGRLRGQGHQASLFAFGGCWAGVIVASALGNSPTPLVGFGGSAVLGYLLSTALLPNRAGTSGASEVSETLADEDRDDRSPKALRLAPSP